MNRAALPLMENKSKSATSLGCVVYPCLILLSVLAVYANTVIGSTLGPFIFDDVPSLVENEYIRSLGTVWQAAFPPSREDYTIAGRPVAALSFAINWAIGGDQIRGYRIVNVSIHALAALLLYGTLARTLRTPPLRDRFGRHADRLAFLIALIWAVHPLCVTSITYVVQRVESLAGMMILLTLYCFIRGSGAQPGITRGIWFAAAVAACLLGMGAKETAAAAPLLVLLYDRTFLSDSFFSAIRSRYPTYIALASTWLILAFLLAASPRMALLTGSREETVLAYLRTQCWAIPHYLRLSIVPIGTVLDYGGPGVGTPFISRPIEYVPGAILVLVLIAGMIYALYRRWPIGFAGAWVLLILAPSSSFIPIAAETVAEHRMYLPLAAVVSVVVLGLCRMIPAKSVVPFAAAGGIIVSLALGTLTVKRNHLFRDVKKLWANDVAHGPDNARIRTALGAALAEDDQLDLALDHLRRAVEMHPTYAETHHNIGNIMLRNNRLAEAEQAFHRAVQLPPPSYMTHYNFGQLLLIQGRLDEAAEQYRQAAKFAPPQTTVWNDIGVRLAQTGRLLEATECFHKALEIDPDNRDAAENLQRATQMLESQRVAPQDAPR